MFGISRECTHVGVTRGTEDGSDSDPVVLSDSSSCPTTTTGRWALGNAELDSCITVIGLYAIECTGNLKNTNGQNIQCSIGVIYESRDLASRFSRRF